MSLEEDLNLQHPVGQEWKTPVSVEVTACSVVPILRCQKNCDLSAIPDERLQLLLKVEHYSQRTEKGFSDHRVLSPTQMIIFQLFPALPYTVQLSRRDALSCDGKGVDRFFIEEAEKYQKKSKSWRYTMVTRLA